MIAFGSAFSRSYWRLPLISIIVPAIGSCFFDTFLSNQEKCCFFFFFFSKRSVFNKAPHSWTLYLSKIGPADLGFRERASTHKDTMNRFATTATLYMFCSICIFSRVWLENNFLKRFQVLY